MKISYWLFVTIMMLLWAFIRFYIFRNFLSENLEKTGYVVGILLMSFAVNSGFYWLLENNGKINKP